MFIEFIVSPPIGPPINVQYHDSHIILFHFLLDHQLIF